MLKKLQNILFEDEDDDILEDDDTMESPVVSQNVAPVTPQRPVTIEREPEPVVPEQPKETVMQRIDVTQSVPIEQTRPQAPKNESVFSQPSSRPAEPKPTSVIGGITADPKPVAKKPAVAKPAKKKEEKTERPIYQFQPVISPIFGVDEKDMNALKTTTSKITEKEKAKLDKNISPIISPMYGTDAEESPLSLHKTVEKSELSDIDYSNAETGPAEDEIPEFSLDDILKVRDEEYAEEQKEAPEELEPLFPDLTFDEDEDDKDILLPNLFEDEK